MHIKIREMWYTGKDIHMWVNVYTYISNLSIFFVFTTFMNRLNVIMHTHTNTHQSEMEHLPCKKHCKWIKCVNFQLYSTCSWRRCHFENLFMALHEAYQKYTIIFSKKKLKNNLLNIWTESKSFLLLTKMFSEWTW